MKIDFVITWVDGNDPNWIKEKNNTTNSVGNQDSGSNRYRDWENLKYWFRGVEKFAPWVNKIYFVTWGHVPEWLDTTNEKLVIVKHKDYIPDVYLPTFSSHPIELNLHRINDLSEHFVYFNDDFFLIDSCSENDFFGNNGLPCDLYVEEPPTFVKKDVFNDIIINNLILINNKFDRLQVLKENRKKIYSMKNKRCFVKNIMFSMMRRHEFFGIEFSHLPQPFLKSMFNRVWIENPDVMNTVCCNKIRSGEDVNQYVIKYYQLLTGQFEPYNWKKTGIVYQLSDANDCNNMREATIDIQEKRYKMICLNDTNVDNFEEAKKRINNAFECILPDKCTFEK